MKPIIPTNLLDLNKLLGTGTPRFFRGPNVKLNVKRIKALREKPLFKIKNGKSFQGTGPKIWYRNTAYPKENMKVQPIIAQAGLFAFSILSIFFSH